MHVTGSLTSHGELCTDTCEKRGYPYFWCHKVVNLMVMTMIMMMLMMMPMMSTMLTMMSTMQESSNLGQWWDSDFCSPLPTVTQYGKECSNK